MTNDGVARLRELTSWTEAPASVDWAALSSVVGIDYPGDFRALVEGFPPGEFQTYLKVLHPAAFATAEEYGGEVAGYAGILRDQARRQQPALPVYPEPGGLVPWATIGLGQVICWLAQGDDSTAWPVVVCRTADGPWTRYDMSTAMFLQALLSMPPAVEELAYVTTAVQPPSFAPLARFRPATAQPSRHYWLEGVMLEPLAEPVEAAADLRPKVTPAPVNKIDWAPVFNQVRRALPYDYVELLRELGPVQIGPARVTAPGGTPDFLDELDQLAARVADERRAGAGPRGPIYPETSGLITWGRLDGGGYLCWVPVSTDADEWPVAVLDASLRFSAVYHMSASRFLLELATHPERVILPPAL